MEEFKPQSFVQDNFKYDLNLLLAKVIISSASSISLAKNKYFKQMFEPLKSKTFCYDSFLDALNQMHNDVKLALRKKLNEEAQFVSLTTDSWTSKHLKKCFFAVTLHFLNQAYEPQSVSLGLFGLENMREFCSRLRHRLALRSELVVRLRE